MRSIIAKICVLFLKRYCSNANCEKCMFSNKRFIGRCELENIPRDYPMINKKTGEEYT